MADFVLDPAIACKWFRPMADEPYVVESRLILDRLARGTVRLHAPAVFSYEFGAWLADVGARGGLDPERTFHAVAALPLELHDLDHELASNAFLAARRHDVDFFTAAYIALAERLICPYVTADDTLRQRLTGMTRVASPADVR